MVRMAPMVLRTYGRGLRGNFNVPGWRFCQFYQWIACCVALCSRLASGSEGQVFAVSCPQGFGQLHDPEFFTHFGEWQSRYGRDNLKLSANFLSTYEHQIEPYLNEALRICPAYVLEVMMNALLSVDTDNGSEISRVWLMRIYTFRDAVIENSSPENKLKLDALMAEWSIDIAAVYPKFLDVERLGPLSAVRSVEEHVSAESGESPKDFSQLESEFCLHQRFYVYELDESFYKPGTFACLQGQWGTEVVMHHFRKQNCRTLNPDEADWFYVPLYATCLYVALGATLNEQDVDGMDGISNKNIWNPLMDTLRKSLYYQRRQGTDHIFLFADGQGPRIWDSYDALRSESVFLSPESKCPTWREPVRRYLDVKPCLSSWKDIIIPGHTDYARIEYMRKQNKPSSERRLLATFHGRVPGSHEAYDDCAVRKAIMKLAEYGPHVDVGGFVADYPERKGDAHFCLVPAGTSPWTNHLYESFYAGCIPVIVSDEYEVAFGTELDWPSFSIKWPEADVGSSLYHHLEEVILHNPGKVMAMKENLEANACWFNWYSNDLSCNPYTLIHQRLRKLLDARRSTPRFWNVASNASANEPPLVFAHLRRPTLFKHFAGDNSEFMYLKPVEA